MGAKLDEGMYKDRFAFEADFHLMIENAKTYNAPGSYVYNEANVLVTFFEKRECVFLVREASLIFSCQSGQLSIKHLKRQTERTPQ